MQLLCQPSAKGPEKHGFLFSSKHFSLGPKNIGRISKSFAVVLFGKSGLPFFIEKIGAGAAGPSAFHFAVTFP